MVYVKQFEKMMYHKIMKKKDRNNVIEEQQSIQPQIDQTLRVDWRQR